MPKKKPTLKIKTPGVIVLSGVPGCGKSTVCEYLKKELSPRRVSSISSDEYFMKLKDGKRVYDFDASKLGEAHAWCFREYIELLQKDYYDILIVDNTNIKNAEIAPYMLAAAAYGRDSVVLEIDCDVRDAIRRQKHAVPPVIVRSLKKTFNTRTLEKFWRRVKWNSNSVFKALT